MISFNQKPQNITLFSGNKQLFVLTSDYPFAVRMTLFFYANSTKTNLLYSISEKKSPTNNIVSFDISAYLDSFLISKNTVIDFGTLATQNKIQLPSYCFVSVKFETIDSENQVFENVLTADYRVLKASTEPDTDFFVDFIKNYSAFLTFAPSPQKISDKSGAFFSYYNVFQRFVKIYCKFYFEDGASSTFTVKALDLAEGVWAFYFSLTELKILVPEFERIEFWAQNNLNQNISNLIKFEIDTKNYIFERVLVVQNSIGGIDFSRLLGEIEDTSKFARISALNDSEIRNIYSERTQTFSVNSGFFANLSEKIHEYQNWFVNEILQANSAYLITAERITEVRINTESGMAYKDGEFTANESFKLESIKVLKSFTTPAIELPENSNTTPENYIQTGYLNQNYYESH